MKVFGENKKLNVGVSRREHLVVVEGAANVVVIGAFQPKDGRLFMALNRGGGSELTLTHLRSFLLWATSRSFRRHGTQA